MRSTAVSASLRLGLVAATLVLVGCSASTSEACGELSEAISSSTSIIVDASVNLATDTQTALDSFSDAQDLFTEERGNWPSDVDDAADVFEAELDTFRDSVEQAVEAQPIDSQQISTASAEFEANVRAATAFCATQNGSQ